MPSFLDLTTTRCRILCAGPDATRYLNGQVTQDIRLVRPGHAMPACLTNLKGKLEAELVIAAAPGAYLIDGPGELRDFLSARLEKYLIADDCTIRDVTDGTSQIHLPGLAEIPPGLPDCASASISWRLGRTGVDILVSAADREALPCALLGTPGDPVAIEDDRIRRGIPVWGRELDATTLPAEAGLEVTHVSYTKGCYIGQEVISRLKSLGQVTRRLAVLHRPAGGLAPGMALAETPEPGNRPLGTLASVSSDGVWALAMVRRPSSLPGSLLYVLPNAGSALSLPVIVADPAPATD